MQSEQLAQKTCQVRVQLYEKKKEKGNTKEGVRREVREVRKITTKKMT